jgi:predicted signal transduction protein with EAL and GGDEF domain
MVQNPPHEPRATGRLPHWPWAVLALFSLPFNDPDLAASQLDMLTGLVPLMYVILLGNAVTLALTHYRYAPKLLTIALPAVLIVLSCWRFFLWVRWRHRRASNATAVLVRLRNIIATTAVLGSAFTAWALSLFFCGGPYLHAMLSFSWPSRSSAVISA